MGSGLKLDSQTGILQGTPHNADVKARQPLLLTVRVTPTAARTSGNQKQTDVPIVFRMAVVRGISILSCPSCCEIYVSSFFCYSYNVKIMMAGGIGSYRLTPITVVIGQFYSYNPLLSRRGADDDIEELLGDPGTETVESHGEGRRSFRGLLSESQTPQSSQNGGEVLRSAQSRLRRYFQIGLPNGSGLVVDSSTGVLSGIPNEVCVLSWFCFF